ncbi:hypothetical protein UY3_12162 [Chelonia mydas]|uniref:Uncharacterized protein n=1 Tax=Chelonia mydas TaxID=8469 RepID=M7B5D0_CHEMY|nr:hypothetical protein UY3_12162 [Chelonia mydas]
MAVKDCGSEERLEQWGAACRRRRLSQLPLLCQNLSCCQSLSLQWEESLGSLSSPCRWRNALGSEAVSSCRAAQLQSRGLTWCSVLRGGVGGSSWAARLRVLVLWAALLRLQPPVLQAARTMESNKITAHQCPWQCIAWQSVYIIEKEEYRMSRDSTFSALSPAAALESTMISHNPITLYWPEVTPWQPISVSEKPFHGLFYCFLNFPVSLQSPAALYRIIICPPPGPIQTANSAQLMCCDHCFSCWPIIDLAQVYTKNVDRYNYVTQGYEESTPLSDPVTLTKPLL